MKKIQQDDGTEEGWCYNLNLKCPPKTHVLESWFPGRHHWEIEETPRGES
jgi:hypothetical protein